MVFLQKRSDGRTVVESLIDRLYRLPVSVIADHLPEAFGSREA